MIKIIFLDIDGVLATPDSLKDNGDWGLVDRCQTELGKILDATGAKIVLTSSWRLHTLDDTRAHMMREGFWFCDDIIGVTIRAYHYLDRLQKVHLSIPRGVEIKQWIDTHIHSDNGKNFSRKKLGVNYQYCIIDDESDMLLEHQHNFIQTNSESGLNWRDTIETIEILNH